MPTDPNAHRPMTPDERKVIFASSLGTVFEWYDFFIFGSLTPVIAKVFLTLGGLLSGASIGREGPSVQVGASVMHLLAGRRRRRIASSRDLIVAGSGAGIAAAFNTPLGGIMFAIEEMCRYRAFQANSTTLTAVIFAGLMSLAVLGNYTYFGRTLATIAWPAGIWPVLACGVAGGLLLGWLGARALPWALAVLALACLSVVWPARQAGFRPGRRSMAA